MQYLHIETIINLVKPIAEKYPGYVLGKRNDITLYSWD